MGTIIEWGNAIWEWFGVEDNQNRAQAIAAVAMLVIAVLGPVLGAIVFVVARIARKKRQPETIETPPPPPALPSGETLTMDQHLAILEKREERMRRDFAAAEDTEKTALARQIAELESQIANPEASFAQMQTRIRDLEALLDREGNEIGGDRLAEARAALEQGDFSLADDIFAEIEARDEIAVQRSARAAFGRGEIAESELRWADAYEHFKRAANFCDDQNHLKALARLCWRLGKGTEGVTLQERLVEYAKSEHGENSAEYASQLNNLASVLKTEKRFDDAEALYIQALEIVQVALGQKNRRYATLLNNLAGAVEMQGRFEEAELLYRQALEIDKATIGTNNSDYATDLNNLAGVVEAQGRFTEAEALYRQALQIDEATIGTKHPDYATDLNNLADLLLKTDRAAEARPLAEQALQIGESTFPDNHPKIASRRSLLAKIDAALAAAD